MTACPWEKINDFQSYSEFERFIAWLDAQIRASAAEETAVSNPYLGATTFVEKWVRHVGSGQVWRVVWPDAPFRGLFEPVE